MRGIDVRTMDEQGGLEVVGCEILKKDQRLSSR